jgi:SAM-dependent methyltransferase
VSADSPDPRARFSGRAADYVKARPGYPDGVLAVLREACGLDVGTVVADLGSGTGIFTRLLLESGATVHAVEPNDDMRREAEAELSSWPGFRSVGAAAEATTLPDASIDLVTAAQAFHWFDPVLVKKEMQRILRSAGSVALVWNDRDLQSTAFLREYEALLVARCPQYKHLQGKADTPEKFDALFGPGKWTKHLVPNEQRLDREGLVRRLASSSYAPKAGDPSHDATYAELEAIFDRHAPAAGGEVVMTYTVVVILGRPA